MQVIGNIALALSSAFMINLLDTLYMKFLKKNSLLKASLFREGTVICSSLIVITYTSNYWYIIPAIMGGFLGTLLTNKISKWLNIE